MIEPVVIMKLQRITFPRIANTVSNSVCTQENLEDPQTIYTYSLLLVTIVKIDFGNFVPLILKMRYRLETKKLENVFVLLMTRRTP